MDPQARTMEDGLDAADELLARVTLDDAPGPAQPLSELSAAALVRGAYLAQQRQPAPDEGAASVPADGGVPRRDGGLGGGRPLWRLAAGVLVLVLALGGALAALVRQRAGRGTGNDGPASLASPPPVVALREPAGALPPAPATVVTAGPPPRSPERPRLMRSPEDLLRLANAQRRALHFREADALYQQVLRGAPRSEAAFVARLASAALRLEHLHDPRTAARLYQQALAGRGGGALALEARRGLAEAYRALGEREAERAALRDLLAAQPDADVRLAAEARLRALGAPAGR